ncbi:unnamed protein product [Orchesella dallaii]|uniref:Uncharacterized protein n=1 Tax=Orchesella dallaii TaxID=48710 RepID=A0ABP1PWS3_9HEXA
MLLVILPSKPNYVPSKRRCSASSENIHVIDLTQKENTPPKKRRILRKEEYTDEQPWPSNYETEGDQYSEDDGVLVKRFSEADLELEGLDMCDQTKDRLIKMHEPIMDLTQRLELMTLV